MLLYFDLSEICQHFVDVRFDLCCSEYHRRSCFSTDCNLGGFVGLHFEHRRDKLHRTGTENIFLEKIFGIFFFNGDLT